MSPAKLAQFPTNTTDEKQSKTIKGEFQNLKGEKLSYTIEDVIIEDDQKLCNVLNELINIANEHRSTQFGYEQFQSIPGEKLIKKAKLTIDSTHTETFYFLDDTEISNIVRTMQLRRFTKSTIEEMYKRKDSSEERIIIYAPKNIKIRQSSGNMATVLSDENIVRGNDIPEKWWIEAHEILHEVFGQCGLDYIDEGLAVYTQKYFNIPDANKDYLNNIYKKIKKRGQTIHQLGIQEIIKTAKESGATQKEANSREIVYNYGFWIVETLMDTKNLGSEYMNSFFEAIKQIKTANPKIGDKALLSAAINRSLEKKYPDKVTRAQKVIEIKQAIISHINKEIQNIPL